MAAIAVEQVDHPQHADNYYILEVVPMDRVRLDDTNFFGIGMGALSTEQMRRRVRFLVDSIYETQTHMAERITGLTQQRVSDYYRGVHNPSGQRRRRINEAFRYHYNSDEHQRHEDQRAVWELSDELPEPCSHITVPYNVDEVQNPYQMDGYEELVQVARTVKQWKRDNNSDIRLRWRVGGLFYLVDGTHTRVVRQYRDTQPTPENVDPIDIGDGITVSFSSVPEDEDTVVVQDSIEQLSDDVVTTQRIVDGIMSQIRERPDEVTSGIAYVKQMRFHIYTSKPLPDDLLMSMRDMNRKVDL